MDSKTKQMILGWIAMHHGDEEQLARWMRDSLRIGLKSARAAIRQAKVAA